MIKKTILAAAMLSIGLCAAAQGFKPYTINVTLDKAADGDTLILAEQTPTAVMPVDTAVIKQKKATFVKADRGYVGSKIIFDIKKGVPLPIEIITTPGAVINISNNTMEPEPNNDLYMKVMTQYSSDMEDYPQLQMIMNDTTRNIVTRFRAKQHIDSLTAVANAHCADILIEGMPLPVCGYIFQLLGPRFDESLIQKVYEAMAAKMPDDPFYKVYKAQMEKQQETAVGRQYKEIALVDLNGNMKRLSEVVKSNKYTLVDFWASWCRPCLAEMPNVKSLYQIYHDKGLEIYGVSLDENQLAWQGAIQRMQLPWIHVSDLKGWQSAGAREYNVSSIPATVLIDQSGKIIARDVRGADLAKLLKDIFK